MTMTIVMNETAFAKLNAFPHSTIQQNHFNIYKWKFLDANDNLRILEFKCGYVILKTSHYTEEMFVYSTDREEKYFERLFSIDEWLDSNLCHLEKTKAINEAVTEVIDKISNPSALGPRNGFAADEHGWVINAPKMHAKILVDMYKDPTQKTIKLEYTDKMSNKSKSGFIDKKQLYTFLKKNMTVLREKEPKKVPQELQQEIEQVTKQLENTLLEDTTNNPVSPVPYHMMSKEEKKNLRIDSKLFIPISKKARIACQSCKPVRGKFDYLLDELRPN